MAPRILKDMDTHVSFDPSPGILKDMDTKRALGTEVLPRQSASIKKTPLEQLSGPIPKRLTWAGCHGLKNERNQWKTARSSHLPGLVLTFWDPNKKSEKWELEKGKPRAKVDLLGAARENLGMGKHPNWVARPFLRLRILGLI